MSRKIDTLLQEEKNEASRYDEIQKEIFESVESFKNFIRQDKEKAVHALVSFQMRIVLQVKHGPAWHVFLADKDTTPEEVKKYTELYHIGIINI